MPNNEKTPEKTLGGVRDLLIDPNGPPLQAMAVLGGQARSAAALLSQAAEETVGGIMSNALGHTKFLDSRGMREMLSGSDFSALDLNKGKTTVYFVLPPEYVSVHQRALRLVVNTFLAAAAKGRKGKHPTLYILDEFYSLGPLSVMTRAAAIMRGYGVRIVLDRAEHYAADRAVSPQLGNLFRQCGAGADLQHKRQGRR